jgi:hypothetical protein
MGKRTDDLAAPVNSALDAANRLTSQDAATTTILEQLWPALLKPEGSYTPASFR